MNHRAGASMGTISPLTVPLAGPVLLAIPAENPRTWTPAEAYSHFGTLTPRAQYARMLAARADGTGPRPYDRDHRDAPLDFRVGP